MINFNEQASKFEKMDDEEHAYQKLEREYTKKSVKAAESSSGNKRGGGQGVAADGGGDGDGDGKKSKKGRWFD